MCRRFCAIAYSIPRVDRMECISLSTYLSACVTAPFSSSFGHCFRKLWWSCCNAYLDDIVVYLKTFEQDLINLESVLGNIRQDNLKVKPSKWSFRCDSIIFLSFLITTVGIRPNPSKIEKIVKIRF